MPNYRPWNIRHVRLEAPLAELEPLPGIDGLYVVFWLRELALGHAMVRSEELPMSPGRLAALAAVKIAAAAGDRLFADGFKAPLPEVPGQRAGLPSADLEELLRGDGPLEKLGRPNAVHGRPVDESSVSVAICTRERPELLRRCLASLKALGDEPREIVVVDNAPLTDRTRDVVAEFERVTYLREPRPGLDRARNAALLHCSGEIIAFTDDDVVVHPNWIGGVRRGFSDPRVMAVAGLVLPAELETEAQMIFETFWSFNRGYRSQVYDEEFMRATLSIGAPVARIGAGANMAFRREVRDLVGLFDERLDVGAAGCNGDSEYWYRVLAEGWRCRYEPSAIVHHHHRVEMGNLKRQLFFYMRGHAASLLVQHERYGHRGNLRRLRRTLGLYPRRFLRKPWEWNHPRQRTLWVEMLGCLDGVRFYWRNRRPRRMKRENPHQSQTS